MLTLVDISSTLELDVTTVVSSHSVDHFSSFLYVLNNVSYLLLSFT